MGTNYFLVYLQAFNGLAEEHIAGARSDVNRELARAIGHLDRITCDESGRPPTNQSALKRMMDAYLTED